MTTSYGISWYEVEHYRWFHLYGVEQNKKKNEEHNNKKRFERKEIMLSSTIVRPCNSFGMMKRDHLTIITKTKVFTSQVFTTYYIHYGH
jgi:hypothetical protein